MIKRAWLTVARSLRVKVLLAFVIVALIPLAILTVFNDVATRRALTDSANRALFAAASRTAARLDAFIEAELAIIKAESQLPTLAGYLRAGAGRWSEVEARQRVLDTLQSLVQKDPVFISSYALLDLHGRNVMDTDEGRIGRDESAGDYYQSALDTGRPFVSSVVFDSEAQQAYFYFSNLIVDTRTQRPLGVLRVRYGAALLQQLLVQDSGLVGPQSYPLLLDSHGVILADGLASPGNPSGLIYQRVRRPGAAGFAGPAASGSPPSWPESMAVAPMRGLADSLQRVNSTDPYFNVSRYSKPEAGAVTQMTSLPWLVVFLEPQASLVAPARAQARDSVVLAGVIVLVVAVVAIAVARLLTQHIVHLTEIARLVAQGNLDARAAIESNDEIGVLAETFNAMTDQVQALIIRLEQRTSLLQQSEEKFRTLVEQIQVAVVVHGADTHIIISNSMAHDLLGLTEDQMQGKTAVDPAWQFLREDGGPLPPEEYPVIQVLASRRALRNFVAGVHRPNQTDDIWVLVSAVPVFGEEGKIEQVIVSFIDITERTHAQEELQHYKDHLEETVEQRTEQLRLARDAAEAANRAKSVFLANMSHEFRTPLNAILGFARLMRQDPDMSEAQRQNLDIINHSGEHLLNLINDVLEIARIEAGKLQLDIETLDLHGMVRDVIDMMRLRAQQKGLYLELDQSSAFPSYVRGDEARLRQILVNLVSNAVKFTHQGGVTVRLGSRRDQRQHLVIEVQDTGPGISKEDQQRLFKPFAQLADGAVQGGTGLGLSIVQQFVRLMGGSIVVNSVPGEGSLFRVNLPLEVAETAEIEHLGREHHGDVAGLAPGQPSYRILIAEDQQDNQRLLVRLMADLGFEVKTADNGEECLQQFQEWQPDLIWMDWRMPVMDGVEATRHIRRLDGGDRVKIVAVTASAFKEQQSELRAAGMDDYVSKPFRISDIYEALARQLGVEYVYREVEPTETATLRMLTPQRMRMLASGQRAELRAAVESLDRQRISVAIGHVCEVDADLGRILAQLTEEFDYPGILSALDTAERDQPPTNSNGT